MVSLHNSWGVFSKRIRDVGAVTAGRSEIKKVFFFFLKMENEYYVYKKMGMTPEETEHWMMQ